MFNKFKQLILKSNQLYDNLKEPYRFLTMFLLIAIVVILYSTNIISLTLYYITLLTLFLWRYYSNIFQK